MHCRAHNVPVTPLTNDVSTASLSSLLGNKMRSGSQPHLAMKHEKFYGEDHATCSMNTDNCSETKSRFEGDENSMET